MKSTWRWLILMVPLLLPLLSCHGPAERDDGGNSRWIGFRPLDATDEAPVYHLLEGYDRKWLEQIEEGVEVARSYWGSFGPPHVWIAGSEDESSSTEEQWSDFIEEYCEWRTSTSTRSIAECIPHGKRQFQEVTSRGDAEAYLSEIRDGDPYLAELIFINVHQWYFKNDPIADPVLRGIHEYTHVFQQSVGEIPTWMAEGGAVFCEAWLPPQQDGWDPLQRMEWVMESALRIDDPDLTIADMEEIETAPEEVARYHRELAYDAGAWATVFMVHNSSDQRVSSLRDRFFPMVKKLGWEDALCRFVGMDTKEEFYAAFNEFMALPREQQLKIYSRLKR